MPWAKCAACAETFHLNVSEPVSWYRERYPKYEFAALVPDLCINCWKKAKAMWRPFESGKTIGSNGSESGSIIRDEEHELGARITLESGTTVAPFAITCGVYGWMFHTRFFSSESEAMESFDSMKDSLAVILEMIPSKDDYNEATMQSVVLAIGNFVERFP